MGMFLWVKFYGWNGLQCFYGLNVWWPFMG